MTKILSVAKIVKYLGKDKINLRQKSSGDSSMSVNSDNFVVVQLDVVRKRDALPVWHGGKVDASSGQLPDKSRIVGGTSRTPPPVSHLVVEWFHKRIERTCSETCSELVKNMIFHKWHCFEIKHISASYLYHRGCHKARLVQAELLLMLLLLRCRMRQMRCKGNNKI